MLSQIVLITFFLAGCMCFQGPNDLFSERSGVSPFWSQAKQCIYFVNRSAGTINRYDTNNDFYFSVKIDTKELLSFVIPIQGQGEKFAVGLGKAVGVVFWDGISNAPIKPEFEIPVSGLILAGKTDFHGKLWLVIAGTTNSVCVMESDGKVTTAISGINTTNAISWGFDYQLLFYIDGNKIKALTANMKEKSLTTRWLVFDLYTIKNDIWCIPVDLLVDMGGYVIVTCSNVGNFVIEINPRNSKVKKIELPTDNTTNVQQPNLISLVYANLSRDYLVATTAGANPLMNLLEIRTSGGSGLESKPVVLPSQYP